jgi:iron complex transport system substrate-binding protein
MKFSSLIFLCAAFQPYAKANEMSCVTNVVDGKDYFPHKAVPEDSQQWSVTYENTYKIVSNPAAGESYLLYQCGTEPPVDQLDGRHAAVLSVPLEEVGVLSTTMLPFIEILGAREKIAAFLGSSAWVSSVCIGELFDQGLLEEVPDPYNATKITNVPLDLPSFVGNFGGTALQTEIKVSVTEEVKNLAAFEWIKFYSLFFNMEESANDIFDATKGRYSCAEENAGLIACGDEKRPVVLWGSYSDFCQGWDVASCPNYYW